MKFEEQELTIYSNQYGYSTRLARKNVNDEWINAFLVVNFKKGVSVPNKSKIKIIDAWLTFYESKEKKNVMYMFINDFEMLLK